MNTNQNPYQVILVLITGFLIIYFIIQKEWLLYLLTGIGILSLTSVFFRDKIVWLWMKLAEVLGFINSRILLGIVFFIILLPLALVRRLFSGFKKEENKKSFYINKNKTYQANDLENMW